MGPYRNSAKEYQEKKTFIQELFKKIMELPCDKFEKHEGRDKYMYSIADRKIGINSYGLFRTKLKVVYLKCILKYTVDDAAFFEYEEYYKIEGENRIKLLKKLQEVEVFFIRKKEEEIKKMEEENNNLILESLK